MSAKITRRRFVAQLGVAGGVAAAGLVLAAGDAGANPDTAHIKSRKNGFKVFPTGVDDQPNIEWAMRNNPPGGTVRLVEGTYKFGPTAVVPDFDGKLVGKGSDRTTLTCADEYSYELWEAPGGPKSLGAPEPPPFPRTPIERSATRTAPGLILFYKTPMMPGEDPADYATSVTVRGLRCRGAMLGEQWTFGDEVLCFTVVNTVDWNDLGAMPETTRQDVSFVDVEVDGYATEAFPVFGNACACITVTGGPIFTDNYDLTGVTDGDGLGAFNGGLLGVVPAEGDVTFKDCTFRNCRLGPGVVGHKDSSLRWINVTTDGCRGNCLQLFDNSNCDMVVRDCDLFCDSFLLPPELTPGGSFSDIPSSLGCVVAFNGSSAGFGYPSNLRWLSLALDPDAHAVDPIVSGPIGTWRPLGPEFIPAPSSLRVVDTTCRSPGTLNSYCLHAIDGANFVLGVPSLSVTARDNDCDGAQTCIGIEHINHARITDNRCEGIGYGVELHNSFNARIRGNHFGVDTDGCEIRELALGEKRDFYAAVAPGICSTAG